MDKFLSIFQTAQKIATTGKDSLFSTPSVTANSTPMFDSKQPFAASNLGIATNTVLGIPKASYNVSKTITDSLTNMPGQILRTAVNFGAGDVPNALVPSNMRQFGTVPAPSVLKVIPGFGNENVQPLASKISSGEQKLQSMGFGKASLPIAFGGVIGSAALDFTPFGGESKVATGVAKNIPFKFLKFVADTVDKNILAKTFESIGIKDASVISNLVDKGVAAKTTDEVLNIFKNPENFVPKKSSLKISSPKSFNDFSPAEQNLMSAYSRDVSNGVGVNSRVTTGLKEIFNKKGLNLPENPKQIASQIELMKQGADNADTASMFKEMNMNSQSLRDVTQRAEIIADAKKISNEGKSTITQPRDTVGRFDFKNTQPLKRKPNTQGGFARLPDFLGGKPKVPKQEVVPNHVVESDVSLNKSIAQKKGIVEGDPLATLRNAEKRVGVKPLIKDATEVQKIKNSIAEARLLLRSGTSNGRKLSAGELLSVRKSVENSLEKIGESRISKIAAYSVEDVTPEGFGPTSKRVGVNRAEYDPGYFNRKPVQLPPKLEEKAISLEIQKEAIANNPLNQLVKYASKTGDNAGHLPEVLGGKGTSGFKKKGDDIITEALGQNVDSETARAQFDKFVAQKKAVKEAEVAFKQEVKALKYSSEGIPMGVKTSLRAGETKPVSPIQSVARTSKVPDYVGSTGEVRSLERLAEQSATVEIRDSQLRKSVSLPRIIEKTATNVKSKINALDYIRTPENVLKKIGLQKEGDVLRRSYDSYLKELPQNIDKITAWSKEVPKESGTRLFKYLDGQAVDITPQELKVANEIKVWLAQWADRLGLPQDNRIANYITHLFDDQLIKKEFDEDLAKIISEKIPGSVYDPFLQKRLGAKGYKEDVWGALDAYVKRATRKVNMDPALANLEEASRGLEESQWNYVKRYSDRINLRPTEIDNIVDNGIKSVIGYRLGQRPVATVTGSLRRATYRGMLGLNVGSALRNLSQGINTYAKLGEKYTVVGYSKLFSPANLAELKTENVLSSQFVQDRSISAIKKTMEKVDKGLFFFFETAEKINRGAAYFGAKSKGIASGMSEKQAIEYGKKIVRETQFAFGSIDTPVGMSSDIVKTLTQFQTFTTKQIEFLAGMAKNKEYAGFIRYAIAGAAFVYTVGQAFGMDLKDLLPIYRIGTPPSLKLPVTAVQMAAGGDKDIGDVVATLPGYIPAGIQVKKTIQGIQSVKQGGSYDKAGRLQFTQGQSPAQQVQSILFGKYASQNAQDYFQGETANVKEKARVQPVYDQVQQLLADGKQQEALDLANSLSDADKLTYKAIKSAETAKTTLQGKKDILPVYEQVQSLLNAGKQDEALSLANNLTDEQKKYYKLVKADKVKIEKAQSGDKPSFNPGEVQSDQGVISTVWTYAKALGVDPATAFDRIFTGQKIRYVSNGTIVVERMSLDASQAEKKAQGSAGSEVKLDHTIPLELGGSNDKSNLKLVPTEVWATYTPVENALGKSLRAGKISKSEAQSLITDFKNGNKTLEEIYSIIK